MAAPADWQMCFKYLWEFLCKDLTPLDGFLFGAQQSGPMIMPLNFLDRLAAVCACSAAIPLLGNAPNRASLRIVFNLAETILSATFALWPAGTLVEVNTCVFALQNIASGSCGIHVHGCRLSGFGTSYEARSWILQIRTCGQNEPTNAPEIKVMPAITNKIVEVGIIKYLLAS
jgi:hypothetical protein